ncbi:MAG: D-amino-acid transaminase [Alphaproteobacteria bacterium]|nr:D-amino-acid transaminase [Alphaproteobacteria bacterium]
MSRDAYVNGRYVPHGRASVHVEDRAYQFADGVYEVVAIQGGRIVDEEPHLDRLDHSLKELRIAWPMTRPALRLVMRELVRRNGVADGSLYLQISRGVAPRDHAFPKSSPRPALVMTTRQARKPNAALLEKGAAVITIPDIRWERCDIKSVSLLPNILGKQKAVEAGAHEAWQVAADGTVTEGTSTNAWIVNDRNELVTRKADRAILSGITRLAVMKIAGESQIKLVERPFTVEEATKAREAFLTSTTSSVLPVTSIDGHKIGGGKPGPIALRLRELYLGYMAAPPKDTA